MWRARRTSICRASRTGSLGEHESPVPGFGVGMTYVILLVEDNERNLKLLRDVLDYAGYDVRVARTAETALPWRPASLLILSSWISSCPVSMAWRLFAGYARAADSGHTRGRGNGPGDEARSGTGLVGRLQRVHREPISVRAFPDQVRSFLSGGQVGTE